MVFIIPAVVFAVAGCGGTSGSTTAGYTDTWQDVKVGYAGNGSTPATRARAFSLRVNASGGNILAIKGYPAGGGRGYSIYPGSIAVDAGTGKVKNYGTPVEPDRTDETGRSTLGSNQIIVVMCSLYEGDADAPPASGDLFTITVDRRCDLTFTPEISYRGGVVTEDGNTVSVAPVSLAVTAGQPPPEATAASASPNTAALRIVCEGWADSRTSRQLSGPRWKPAETGVTKVRLTPAQRQIVLHWLSTSTVADYTGDRICNVSDWARACKDDFLKTGVIWGKTSKAFAENLAIYIREADEREEGMIHKSREHQELVQTRAGWKKMYADKTGQPK